VFSIGVKIIRRLPIQGTPAPSGQPTLRMIKLGRLFVNSANGNSLPPRRPSAPLWWRRPARTGWVGAKSEICSAPPRPSVILSGARQRRAESKDLGGGKRSEYHPFASQNGRPIRLSAGRCAVTSNLTASGSAICPCPPGARPGIPNLGSEPASPKWMSFLMQNGEGHEPLPTSGCGKGHSKRKKSRTHPVFENLARSCRIPLQNRRRPTLPVIG
jgi:hypothetical protein